MQVEAYLKAFAEAHGLEHLVRCRTRVTRVEPLPADSAASPARNTAAIANGDEPSANSAAAAAGSAGPAAWHRWRVISEPVPDDPWLSPVSVPAPPDMAGGGDAEEFGAVVVCNGHYSEPRLPMDSGVLLALRLFKARFRLDNSLL